MTTIKRIRPLSVGKIFGIIAAVFGFIIGAIFSLASLVGFGAATMAGDGGALAMLVGAGAIVVLPIVYGLIGFVGGVLEAFIYNIAAGFIGGIEVELSDG